MNLVDFYKEICALAAVTRTGDWLSEGEEGTRDPSKMAKAIAPARWGEAFRLVREVHRAVPRIPLPTPGADPAGHVCLTWELGGDRVVTQIRNCRIEWQAHNSLREMSGVSTSLSDFVAVLDQNFARVRAA